jgi:hypothetical protein
MKQSMLRTVQVGVALLVVGVLLLSLLVITGVLGRAAAIDIATDVAAAIGACVVAGIVLIALLGVGRSREP